MPATTELRRTDGATSSERATLVVNTAERNPPTESVVLSRSPNVPDVPSEDDRDRLPL
ncbi:hypothetical protein [Halococcus sp. IIIV-5B]|uniref:hypothetical protein n=1 Tax=Halococcus sp. IIIV-5B TaxID=2321230 RepID=UPI0013140FEA|nr:hypothetical protein [Halococcus sp. IIIV-5B]